MSLILVVALDVVIACALHWVFSPVNKGLSIVAAAMRLVYSAVFMVAIAQLPGVLRLLTDDCKRAVLGADHVDLQASLGLIAFTDIWYISQFLFGLHLLDREYLAYRSGHVPDRWARCLRSRVSATPPKASAPPSATAPGPRLAPSPSSASSS